MIEEESSIVLMGIEMSAVDIAVVLLNIAFFTMVIFLCNVSNKKETMELDPKKMKYTSIDEIANSNLYNIKYEGPKQFKKNKSKPNYKKTKFVASCPECSQTFLLKNEIEFTS